MLCNNGYWQSGEYTISQILYTIYKLLFYKLSYFHVINLLFIDN